MRVQKIRRSEPALHVASGRPHRRRHATRIQHTLIPGLGTLIRQGHAGYRGGQKSMHVSCVEEQAILSGEQVMTLNERLRKVARAAAIAQHLVGCNCHSLTTLNTLNEAAGRRGGASYCWARRPAARSRLTAPAAAAAAAAVAAQSRGVTWRLLGGRCPPLQWCAPCPRAESPC